MNAYLSHEVRQEKQYHMINIIVGIFMEGIEKKVNILLQIII